MKTKINEETEVEERDEPFYWHHRTIEHINSRFPDHEPYLTVHEFTHTRGKYDGFVISEASPRSKQEAQWILNAFDAPPVVRVDDASITEDACGFEDYDKWEWLDREVKKVKEV